MHSFKGGAGRCVSGRSLAPPCSPQFNSLKYSAVNLLFLGDYVDRGPYSVETAAWILAMRAKFPLRVNVLRGNHEFYSVNGDEATYGSGSFFAQCKVCMCICVRVCVCN